MIHYQDEAVTLYRGEALAVLSTLPDESVDLVLTDPPYSSGGQFRADRNQTTRTKYVSSDAQHSLADFPGDSRDQRSYMTWCALWLAECWRVLKPGRAAVVFTDWRQLPTASDAIQAGGFVWRGVGVWAKATGRPSPGIYNGLAEYVVWGSRGPLDLGHEVYIPTVIHASSPTGDNRQHQTQKPLGLMERLCDLCPPGGIVLDPFVGSGTTMVAAKTTGRRGIGVEITAHYADVAAGRLVQSVIPVCQSAHVWKQETIEVPA